MRMASDSMVVGLMQAPVVEMLPSITNSFGTSWALPRRSTTELAGASPAGASRRCGAAGRAEPSWPPPRPGPRWRGQRRGPASGWFSRRSGMVYQVKTVYSEYGHFLRIHPHQPARLGGSRRHGPCYPGTPVPAGRRTPRPHLLRRWSLWSHRNQPAAGLAFSGRAHRQR